ncbi:hypothetical protein SFHH103_03991 (plasmid) [Sinorhizobium fredii HH103]|uniref:Uncharacterized protein n=1 Tax=Sinorhizobium fredii (strain HH103) TaxID=1117943 RepID=G9ABQ3_SINF1|nr:hypothetical protein SFHH103_03991 [Sinorhizobium fredii HH103]
MSEEGVAAEAVRDVTATDSRFRRVIDDEIPIFLESTMIRSPNLLEIGKDGTELRP